MHDVLSMLADLFHNLQVTDASVAMSYKIYANTCSNAKQSDLMPGDTVLLRQPKQNKLSTPYDPRPYQVESRKGSMISVRGGGRDHNVTRNSSFFKKVNIPYVPQREEEEEEPVADNDTDQPAVVVDDKHDTETVRDTGQADPQEETTVRRQPPRPILKSPVARRSSRVTKKPVRFRDYVQCIYV